MRTFTALFVVCSFITKFSDCQTLSGNNNPTGKLPYTVDVADGEYLEKYESAETGYKKLISRRKRVIGFNSTIPVDVKVNELDDKHKQLMVHWVGEGSSVIICLARDPAPLSEILTVNPSAVYISYNYGDSYENKTDNFKLADGNYSTLEKFYNHPKFNSHFVFTDVKHKTLFVTSDYGRNIKSIKVNFAPTDVSFHEFSKNKFLVHDDNDPKNVLYLTEDFGNSFVKLGEFVKSFHWMKGSEGDLNLIQYRMEPSGVGTIFFSSNLFKISPSTPYAFNVKDIYIKGDYIFTTKEGEMGNIDLYVSYKFGPHLKCLFDTQLPKKSYFVVDVTENRALVAVSHGKTISHLYVSDNLGGSNAIVEFTISLEDVLCYFPNNTWHDTLMQLMAEDTFADVYRVEGLSGIYIASRIVNKPDGNNLGPHNLGSVITFDHGATWRLIRAPERDNEGQLISCDIQKNCSLHLSQKFSHLYPDTKTISILSSKSAPGILVATGIVGNSLKGHYGVYVSNDAGWTWRQALKDLYFFNMGDHGGLLTAVKYYKSRGETKHILFSTDEGETWNQTSFHKDNLRLYGLMTEPGENTTAFTMFGSLPEYHKWIIIKLDLIKIFPTKCTKDDYKTWSPSQSDGSRSYVPCVMGQQKTYRRRLAHANCYNGLDFDFPISTEPCNCDILDYECSFGFVRSNKRGQCVRNKTMIIDPYKVPENCPPGTFYNRTKGYRKIAGDSCEGGFEKHYLPEAVPCPFNEIQDFVLFAQRERISRFNLVTRTLEELPVKNLKNVIAIDFDMKNNCVFWADIALDIIGRQCLNNGNASEILVSSDLASIEGMAFDWLANTLYFVDGMRSKIELIRTDINHSGRMRRTILGPRILKKPRGIALHPNHGYMYWTDWSADNPSVNRADLDGKNTKTLFKKPIVSWPNGIAIDYIAERIYWVDARQDYIASADLHGDDMKFIIKDNEVVSHPFAVAVFKSSMFWDDWKRNAIFSADKDSSIGELQGLEVLQKELSGLMDLKVFAHGIQIGNNTCNSKSCSYLCVGSPKDGHTCLCPDGLIMTNGDCLCPGKVKPSVNGTCPKQSGTCASDHFTCADNTCIPAGWRCDGEPDCNDDSDELNCKTQSCPPFYFVCGDGKCIPHVWRCDFSRDCADGSDELNCPKPNCTKDQFTCQNGRCVSLKFRCDGSNDCNDNSDELNCSSPEPTSCKDDEFKCKSGGTICIPESWRCDKERDCRDGSDEIGCENNQCSEDRFFCGPPSNACIYSAWVCDGEPDCNDGRDEKNCTQAVVPKKPKVQDLFHAQNGVCIEWMFKCRNEKCVPYWWRCDDSDDCGDGSDELGCHNNQATPASTTEMASTAVSLPKICGPNQFQCHSGICILSSWLCDGIKDCFGGEDEANCSIGICDDSKHFRCRRDGSCILKKLVCDKKKDCPDGTDELGCEVHLPQIPEHPKCEAGFFACDSSRCLPLPLVCDGRIDCADGSDESHCENTTKVYQVLLIGADERGMNETTIGCFWWLPIPSNVKLDFMPSVNQIGEKTWQNTTWTDDFQYEFTKLKPFTSYNFTVYVRNRYTGDVFPPSEYFVTSTKEGVPTHPWNVTVRQLDNARVLVSWNKPSIPNGIITSYEISWKSIEPNSLRSVKLSDKNETSHILSSEFQHNVTYSFYVTAYNSRYKSAPSEMVAFSFEKDSNLDGLKDFSVVEVTNSSVTLSWHYTGPKAEGFHIDIVITDPAYPKLEPRITKKQKLKIDGLSPGVMHQFKIYAYKGNFMGPVQIISQSTTGKPLPEITGIKASIDSRNGTTAKVIWDRPNRDKNVNWTYGVYYGVDADDLFSKPKMETQNLTTLISKLGACVIYTFTVGIVGPMGYGPISHKWVTLTTYPDPAAAPKRLTVSEDNNNPLRMRLRWEPSCQNEDTTEYIIKVYQQNSNTTSFIKKKVQGTSNVQHAFDVSYGGIYNVSVSTAAENAHYTPYVVYYAPPLPPPYEVKVFVENNGSYVLYWQEQEVPQLVGSYKYEVFVSPGNMMDNSNSQKYIIDRPPFIYTNFTSKMYSFGVRIRTHDNFTSQMSEIVPISNEFQMSLTLTKNSASTVLICIITVFVMLSAIIGILFIRHRKLQKSFTRFANSHYDTRSGAATFDDNHGLDDEIPRIQGFSDDEPLVIA